MEWLKFLAGIAIMTAGCAAAAGGLRLAIGSDPRGRVMCSFLRMFGLRVFPFVVLTAAAAQQQQFTMLLTALTAVCVFGPAAAAGILAVIRPYRCGSLVLRRETRFLFAALAYLFVIGLKTWQPSHPDVRLGRISGVVFLIFFLAECRVLLRDSMRGYPIIRKQAGWPMFPAIVAACAAVCLAAGGGVVTAGSLANLADQAKAEPGVWGMAAGLLLFAAAFLLFFRTEGKQGMKRIQIALSGPASLAFSGSLGLACLLQPVVLSAEAARLSAFALLVLMFETVGIRFSHGVGRVLGICLLGAVCAVWFAAV